MENNHTVNASSKVDRNLIRVPPQYLRDCFANKMPWLLTGKDAHKKSIESIQKLRDKYGKIQK